MDHIGHGLLSSLLRVVNVGDEHNKHDKSFGFLQSKKPTAGFWLAKIPTGHPVVLADYGVGN
jgi:hypothetical protein